MTQELLTEADFKKLPIPQGALAWYDGDVAFVGEYRAYGWEVANGQASVLDPTYMRPNYLDDRLPRGASSDVFGVDGSWTHIHNILSHPHSLGGETDGHQYFENGGDTNHVDQGHGHDTDSNTGTLGAADHTPPHRYHIPMVYCLKGSSLRGRLDPTRIKATGLPAWKIILGYSKAAETIPSGWGQCVGGVQNGVNKPDVRGKFLKGVPGSGSTPGATGGSTKHAHYVVHSHGVTGTSTAWDQQNTDDDNRGYFSNKIHTHPVTASGAITSETDHLPCYDEMHFICFVGYGPSAAEADTATLSGSDLKGALHLPRGLTFIWGVAGEVIPAGYAACDGGAYAHGNPPGQSAKPSLLGQFIRHTTGGSGGAGGGRASHADHAGGDHGHNVLASPSRKGSSGGGPTYTNIATAGHGHPLGAYSLTSVDAQNNLPPYYEVAFVVRD
jgi:hypothetical protein